MLKEFIAYLHEQLGEPYLWGGQHTRLTPENYIAVIEKKEANRGKYPDGTTYAQAVIDFCKKKFDEGATVLYAYDCSGYVSWCLIKAGASERRRDCDGLFARSTEIYTPENGCLLFRVNPKNKNDETHVGIYFNGMQYHAKGRAYGVVCEPYNEKYWQKLAWFKALKPDPKPEPPEPAKQKVLVKGNSVRVRDADSTNGKTLFVAHKGQSFELIDIAPSGWYHIMTTFPDAYITNKERYTELKDE